MPSFELGPTELDFGASVGAAYATWVGNGADPTLYDPVGTEGILVVPASGSAAVHGPYGALARVRVEVVPAAPALEVAEALVGWDAPDGYGGVEFGRVHVPLSRDRRYESEDLTLTWRPALSRVGSPEYAPGAKGTIAWPTRGALSAGVYFAEPASDIPFTFARLDLTPLGALPEREDGDADGFRFGLGGGLALRSSAFSGFSSDLAGDVWVGWRSLALDAGWISRRRADGVADDQWVGGHSRIVRLPQATDLFFAGRVEWIDGIVAAETARNVATGRLSWRIHPPPPERAQNGLDVLGLGGAAELGDAWAAVYVEGTFSREAGPEAPEPTTGTALTLAAERPNDTLTVGAWARW